MKTWLKKMVVLLCILLPTALSYAQDRIRIPVKPPTPPTPIERDLVYTVEPDYRRCAAPFCGGWWLTPVNRVSVALPTDEDLESGISPAPTRIYVAEIDYSKLNFSREDLYQFEYLIRSGQALIRGALIDFPSELPDLRPLKSLRASQTWYAANTNEAIGIYLDVRSTHMVCITSPCPYYEANQVNTSWRFLFHDIDLKRARLTEKQMAIAKKRIQDQSLMMTGVRYAAPGAAGDGVGVAATQVYFNFPDDF